MKGESNMTNNERKVKTERSKLAGKRRHKSVDMEWVYSGLDSGRTVKEVAGELGISESTLRRRHREYQDEIRAEKESDSPFPF